MIYIISKPAGNRISEYILNAQHLPDDARMIWIKEKKQVRFVQHILMWIRSLIYQCFGVRLFSGFFFIEETLQALHAIKPEDIVILFDIFNARHQRLVAQEINSKYIRVFLWDCLTEFFFDLKKSKRKADNMLKNGFEIYTYSPIDAQNFGFTLIPQLYTGVDASTGHDVEPRDILFVGKDRRRHDSIRIIIERIKREHISNRICIMMGGRDKKIDFLTPYYITERISYPDMLDMVKASRCLLEVIRGDNSGWTLRTMEALMYDKKLITTNRHIVEAPFYHPSNIYIWGKDQRSLSDFLSEPYQSIQEGIKSQYYFENWIRNFIS